MTLDRIIVLLTSLGLSAYIYWYFLAQKEKEVVITGNSVDITVDGGYIPQTIIVKQKQKQKQKQKITLNFHRKDPSDCLSEVMLSDFGKHAFLPLHQTTPVEITTSQAGEFTYACGMNMYHGKIIVEE